MRCYLLTRDFGCKTSSGVAWALERDGPHYRPEEGHWHPRNHTEYEVGGNTWFASGKVTEDSKEKMSRLWVHVVNAKKPLTGSHVIGDYTTWPQEEVIVVQAFVNTMEKVDPCLFDFTLHHRVWDPARMYPPWDGPFYFATLLPTLASFDLHSTDIIAQSDAQERFRGAFISNGSRRVVRASVVAGRLVWRDTYTRNVLCNEPFLELLAELGVSEWQAQEIEVLDDRH